MKLKLQSFKNENGTFGKKNMNDLTLKSNPDF